MKKRKKHKTRPDKSGQGNVYIALLHNPVYNKNKETVTTSITGFDLHDISRSALTYGITRYYVINPLEAQRQFAARIINCWKRGESFKFNPTRANAFKILKLVSQLDDVLNDIEEETGELPRIISTSAKASAGIRFKKMRLMMEKSRRPYLILFGTGWGLAKEIIDRSDIILEPIVGRTEYRHLSVRSAVAIVLDRLFGQ